ncbi:MAG: DNA mismatch repair protein MutT [Alphaproteobacteria bacterium HGW-Alphaproteobacteria-14]|nr:MAG: DNA mismatch repair protein MutT [Alphaproteobacteria bacterium HGW-Alphaproteobacteria-14]
MTQRWTAVVAGALMGRDGRWLMHKRPPGKHHAGLWEFPGGKVEPYEMPLESLIRELHEELGIRCDPGACAPAGFAETRIAQTANAIVILLYTVRGWDGVPDALEGGEIGWFTPQEVRALAKPPLDVVLAQQLFQNR